MIREIVYDALRTSAALQALGTAADGSTIWLADSVDTLPVKPAWVMRWSGTASSIAQSTVASQIVGENVAGTWRGAWIEDLQLWAHDEGLDYARVDAMLEKSRDVLSALVGVRQTGGTGMYLNQMTWQGNSPNLRDFGYGTVARYSTWRVAMGRG